MRWEVRPWRKADGTIGGIIIFSERITERKQAEEAQRQSETQFRTIANSIPTLCWMAKSRRLDHLVQRALVSSLPAPLPEQMEGWGWQSVHDPNVLPKSLETWRASLRDRQTL